MNLKPVTPMIKSFDCADHDPIDSWRPNDSKDVDIWVNFGIGMPGEDGADNFQAHIVTEGNSAKIQNRKYLIRLSEYSWTLVLEEIEKILQQCKGTNWDDISEKLSKYLFWEYENYIK